MIWIDCQVIRKITTVMTRPIMGVGELEADRRGGRAGQHGERVEAVGVRVVAAPRSP
jgi:hypothetical protein